MGLGQERSLRSWVVACEFEMFNDSVCHRKLKSEIHGVKKKEHARKGTFFWMVKSCLSAEHTDGREPLQCEGAVLCILLCTVLLASRVQRVHVISSCCVRAPKTINTG